MIEGMYSNYTFQSNQWKSSIRLRLQHACTFCRLYMDTQRYHVGSDTELHMYLGTYVHMYLLFKKSLGIPKRQTFLDHLPMWM